MNLQVLVFLKINSFLRKSHFIVHQNLRYKYPNFEVQHLTDNMHLYYLFKYYSSNRNNEVICPVCKKWMRDDNLSRHHNSKHVPKILGKRGQ